MSGVFRHILVAVDFAHSSDRALELAVKMAIESAAQLTLVTASEVSAMVYEGAAASTADLVSPAEDAPRAQMTELVAEVRKRWAKVDGFVRYTDPVRGVLDTVRETQADLIVVGTHARQGVDRLISGSIAEGIVRAASVPVLIVHAG
jgi:nucleotide-binding universal stress UspA family protein